MAFRTWSYRILLLIPACLPLFSCGLEDSPDSAIIRISVPDSLVPAYRTYDSMRVILSHGDTAQLLFHRRFDSPEDFHDLDAPGYRGENVVIRIQGFRHDTLVYQVDHHYGGRADKDTVVVVVDPNRHQPVTPADTVNPGTGYAGPLLDSVPDLDAREGQAFSLILEPAVDSIQPAFAWSGLPAGAHTQGPRLDWTPGYDQSGSYTVTVTASLGQRQEKHHVRIRVADVNRKPVLSPIPDRQVDEGAPLTFTLSATDPDGPRPALSCHDLPTGAILTDSVFAWTPKAGQKGYYHLTCLARDTALADSQAFTITVGDLNRPPVLSNVHDTTIAENQGLAWVFTATDPDGTVPRLSADSLPPGATFTADQPAKGQGTLAWKPDFTQGRTAPYTVYITASDDSLSKRSIMHITVTDVDRAPKLSPIPAQSVKEGSPLTFPVSATDSDGTTPTLSILHKTVPGNPAFANGTFSWTPAAGLAGTYTVTFQATDGQLVDTTLVSITVTAGDRPPKLGALSAQTGKVGGAISFPVTASDPDGTTPTITIKNQNLPSAPSLSNGTFTWTATQEGTFSVTFQASDGQLVDTASVSITVVKVNHPPKLAPVAAQSVKEGDSLKFVVSATDTDGTIPTISIVRKTLPGSPVISQGTFLWKAVSGQAGTYSITLQASDGELTDTLPISITVLHTNHPPVAQSTGNSATTTFEKALTVTIGGDDDDGSLAAFETQNPMGGSIAPVSGTMNGKNQNLTFAPAANFSGDGSFQYRLKDNDGAYSDWTTFTVTVGANQKPVIQERNPTATVGIANGYSFAFTAKDPEGQPISWALANAPAGMAISPAGTVTWKLDWTTWPLGSYIQDIKAIASDSKGGKDTVTWGISVGDHVWTRVPGNVVLPGKNSVGATDSSTILYLGSDNTIWLSQNRGGDFSKWVEIPGFVDNTAQLLRTSGSNISFDFTPDGRNEIHIISFPSKKDSIRATPFSDLSDYRINTIGDFIAAGSEGGAYIEDLIQSSSGKTKTFSNANNDILKDFALSNTGDLFYLHASGSVFKITRSGASSGNGYVGAQMEKLCLPYIASDTFYVFGPTAAARCGSIQENPAPLSGLPAISDMVMLTGKIGIMLGIDGNMYFTSDGFSKQKVQQSLPGKPNLDFMFLSGDGKAFFAYDIETQGLFY